MYLQSRGSVRLLSYMHIYFYLFIINHLLSAAYKLTTGPLHTQEKSVNDIAVLRSVQYVHCVMHKCIMVKLEGNEKHIKYVKKTGTIPEIMEREYQKGEIINFPK